MLRNEPTLQPGFFKLPEDPVADRALIPGFRAATSVRGAFGWFTAGWIGRLAPGLAEYLNREETKPIDFTVAPAFFRNERTAVERGARMTAEEAAQLVVDVFVKGRAEASALARHALDCLAWMIATKTLRLRIAVPTPESNYHPKIWLFDDGENQVLARGSGNATDRGVAAGVEHIDVDVSWLPESQASGSGSGRRHARRLVARQEPRDRGGRRTARGVWHETSSEQHLKRRPNPDDYANRRKRGKGEGRQLDATLGAAATDPRATLSGPRARTLTKVRRSKAGRKRRLPRPA